MFLYCKWKGKRVDCKHYVKQMKTDTGFCCSINAINLAENYVVPEDDKDNVNTIFNGCSYYSYSSTSSYAYPSTFSPCRWSKVSNICLISNILDSNSSKKRRRRGANTGGTTTTTPSNFYSTTYPAYTTYYDYMSSTSYYDYCYNSYSYYVKEDENSVIQR